MTDLPATPPGTLTRARRIALAHGLRYVYTGNVRDRDGDATLCPGCGQVVIQRDWYNLVDWRLKNGRCAACDEPIAGVFEERPGTWGARRAPVAIRS
jgi:pyruvate formate lyase activating enzyme